MKFANINTTVLILAAAGVGLALYLGRKAAAEAVEVAESAVEAITPTNPENIFYSGVSSVGEAITGDENWTLGSAIYDMLHKEEMNQ